MIKFKANHIETFIVKQLIKNYYSSWCKIWRTTILKSWIMGRIRSCRFLPIFTLAFLIFLALRGALTLSVTLKPLPDLTQTKNNP